MRQVRIINHSRSLPGTLSARFCESFFCRLRGLTFRRSLESDEGLLLVQNRENRMDAAIHMLFMWMDLAVIWLDASLNVVDLQLAHSWHPFYIPRYPAQYILEVSTDWLHHFQIGDQIRFEETNLD